MMATIFSGATLPTPITAEVGYTLIDADGGVIAARSNVGVVQIFQGDGYGIYQASVDVDDEDLAELYAVVWDDGAGNAKAAFRGVAPRNMPGQFVRPSKLFVSDPSEYRFQPA
jgi:hypothetical protein